MTIRHLRLLALALSCLPTFVPAQPASAPAGPGWTVSIASADAAAVQAFIAAYRGRGFVIDESTTVTRVLANTGWSFDTASAPLLSSGPPADVVTTVRTVRAHHAGGLDTAALQAESRTCNDFLGRAGGTCKVEMSVGR